MKAISDVSKLLLMVKVPLIVKYQASFDKSSSLALRRTAASLEALMHS